jgi:hypothetical protein
MVFPFSAWRSLAVLTTSCLLTLGLGCKGKSDPNSSSASTVTISGTVTYKRIPLVTDPTTGVPLGLETDSAKFLTLPLRGVVLYAYQGTQETNILGQAVTVWKAYGPIYTGTDGTYSVKVTSGLPTFMEVVSTLKPLSGSEVKLMATSLTDITNMGDRARYYLRKGIDGSSPAGNQTPGTTISADAKVDFSIDISTPWWIGPEASPIVQSSSGWAPSATLETTGTGSRIAAIIDSAYTFGTTIGDPTPGTVLSLHYSPNNPDIGPSFVEYDRTVYPQSWSGSILTYFGYIRATAANDDAWDEGVLFPLLARNFQMSQGYTALLPSHSALDDRSDLQDLRPDMALIEGFSQAIAAVLLKSPYLADTSAGGVTYRDIRVTSGLGTDAYSAANVAAIAWMLNLNANGTLSGTTITPVADTPTGWATLTQKAINRFFAIVPYKDTTYSYANDIGSLYSQIARLKETQGSGDAVNLAGYFPDATLTTLLAPFHITWPRPTTTATLPDPLVPDAGFMADWGKDPNSLTKTLPSFTLSMANAHKNRLNQYPNFSKGEIFDARFTLSADKIYQLNVLTPSGIPAGAQVQVMVGGGTYLFDSGNTTMRLPALSGNSTTPVFQRIQVRLLSPAIQQADLPVTIQLNAL